MAKRSRASRSAHRPGGQGPTRSKKPVGAPDAPDESVAASPPGVDVDAAVEAADPVEAGYTELTIEEAAPASAPARATRRRSRRRAKAKSDELEVRAASESVWVRADLRRIAFVSAVLLVALAVAWIVFVVLDVLRLY